MNTEITDPTSAVRQPPRGRPGRPADRSDDTRTGPNPAASPAVAIGSAASARGGAAGNDLRISAGCADALFASALQRSDEPSARQIRQAIAAAIGAYGDLGCAARVAQAYGEHPETAVTRMRWARMAVAGAFSGAQPESCIIRIGPTRRPAWRS